MRPITLPVVTALLSHIYAFTASAAPALTNTGTIDDVDAGMHKIEIEIEKSPNPSHGLFRRVPYKTYCPPGWEWVGRSCYAPYGPRAWVEQCARNARNTRVIQLYHNAHTYCPPNTGCMNNLDRSGRPNIGCPGNPKQDQPLGGTDFYCGMSALVEGVGSSSPIERIVSFKIPQTIQSASIGAVVKSQDGSFIVEPSNISANIQGKNFSQRLCDLNTTTIYCEPNQQYVFDVKQNDIVNISFGIKRFQIVEVEFCAVGRHPDNPWPW